MAAARENAKDVESKDVESKDVESKASDDPGIEYTVVWAAVSVHIEGQDEPVTVNRGEKLPAEAAGQGPFLRSIGAVSAAQKA